MFERQKTSTSEYENHTKHKTRNKILNKKNEISYKNFSLGIIAGICLTIITIILQFVAFFTPHWKEISPNTNSLYVDNVDALIRTEILHYFNSVHRYSRHSYGLFQRCEYILNNSTKFNNQEYFFDSQNKKCTKNYLPSYRDDHFNECHSLQYYRFCTKASAKIFDINNDYLRATFDISYYHKNPPSTFSCDCQYPPYVLICHIIGTLAVIFLFLTLLLFIIYPCLVNPHHQLKVKCFAILSTVLAIIFLLINLIIIFRHLEYESLEYLMAIQRHYKINQIYKLSQDTKTAMDKFLSSIRIRIGYSAIFAWIAFALSIIDGIFIITTCKIKGKHEEKETRTSLLSSQNDEHMSPIRFTALPNDAQSSFQLPPPSPPPLPSKFENQRSRIQFEDAV